jgi:hypothetical protein
MKVGRPLKFKTVQELQEKIDEYFEYCDNKTKKIHSEKLGDMIVPDPEPYAMSGLAYYLDIGRRTLINYKRRDEFLPTIKKARRKIEADVERRMNGKDTFTPGLIFNSINNFGWKQKNETDLTSNGQSIVIKPVMYGDNLPEQVPTEKLSD